MMNAQKKGMVVICGNSIAELERELEMLKLAISTGATMGCGGATLGETEKALSALKSVVGGVPPIAEGYSCCDCECCGCCDCEDDEEEYCPICGDILEDGYCLTCGYPDEEEEEEYCPNCGDILDEDGYCDNCGYPDVDEDEEEPTPSELLHALMECLENRGERTTPIGALLDLLDGMM